MEQGSPRRKRQSILVVSILLIASVSMFVTVGPYEDLKNSIDGDDSVQKDADPEYTTSSGVWSDSYIYGPDVDGPNGKYRLAFWLNGSEFSLIGWYSTSGYTEPSGAVVIPETVTYDNATYTVMKIGPNSLASCENITSIEIPSTVTSIADRTFQGCSSLESITFDQDNPYYTCEDGALYNKDMTVLMQYPIGNPRTSFTVPATVTSIANYAFYGAETLLSADTANATVIGKNGFQNCSALTTIMIPNVTEIGNEVFKGCADLVDVDLMSVTVVGDFAFNFCKKLVPTNMGNITSIGIYAFSSCESIISMDLGSIVSLGRAVFSYCYGLKTVTIPACTTDIGENAFQNCISLVSIEVEAGNPNYSSDGDGVLYDKNRTQLLQYPIGNARTSYEVLSSVKIIGSYAFAGGKILTSVDLGSIESISNNAFGYCTALTKAVIPQGTVSINNSAFGNCSSLVDAQIPASIEFIGMNAFSDCPIPSPDLRYVKTVELYAFSNCKNITSIELTNATYLGKGAFSGCSGLKSVVLGNSLTTIGESAFQDCTALGSVSIPSSVTSVGDRAFQGCTSMTSVFFEGDRLPSAVGRYAFLNSNKTLFYSHGDKAASWWTGKAYTFEVPRTGAYYELTMDKAAGETVFNGFANAKVPASINGYQIKVPIKQQFIEQFVPAGSVLLYSTDGGTTWAPLTSVTLEGDQTSSGWIGRTGFTVTYDLNNGYGTVPPSLTGYGWATLHDGSGVWRTGYYLAGWNTLPDGTGDPYGLGFGYDIRSDGVFYADWKQYSVSYDGNSGSGAIPQQSGIEVTLSDGTEFTRPGYTLTGWNTSPDGTGTPYDLGETVTLTADMVLYAIWVEDSPTPPVPPDPPEPPIPEDEPSAGSGFPWMLLILLMLLAAMAYVLLRERSSGHKAAVDIFTEDLDSGREGKRDQK